MIHNKLKVRISVFLLLISLILSSCYTPQKASSSESIAPLSELQIHIIDVGNADAILVLSSGSSLLIDAGENNDGDDVVNYIRSQGVQSLDYAIATHPDADHIGGMDVVINELPVKKFIMSFMPKSITPTTRTYLDLLEALDNNDVDVIQAVPNNRYTLGEAGFTILAPIEEFNSTNNMSVVCRVDFGKRRFLFMGDAEKEEENSLLENSADLKADFIKLGHHGSRTSSQQSFLKAVNPIYAVITCGAGNRYGHPHSQVLATLKKMDITYFRTDIDGTITVLSDGNDITVERKAG
jgi:competence protein ComEC